MINRIICRIAVVGSLALFTGCLSAGRHPDISYDSQLGRARAMLDRGENTRAMLACIDLSRQDPDMPGLKDLQNDIVKALNEQRAKEQEAQTKLTARTMSLDADARKVVPYSYGVTRRVAGETGSLRTPSSDVEKLLRKRITVHLDNVDVNQFIMTVGAAENINMIADGQIAGAPGAAGQGGKTMTLHAEDTPLIEILDYVSRNLDVSFSIGDRIIWVTSRQSSDTGIPMETRMYRLRKAISGDESEDAEEGIDIVRTIKRFVPDENGADLLFNRKAHMLIARNTRDNLALIEDVIEALDVCPPQILIEARFITTELDDLSELGIDWVLNSAVGITKKDVMEGGVEVSKNKTEIDSGATAGFTEFKGAAQGLNFTYRGILTDPLFEATLHALEASGKSKTLSVPRVTTVNNRPAKIRIGKDFRYFEQYDVMQVIDGRDNNNNPIYRSVLVPSGTPALEELGIELQVTPSVGADMASVTLSMKPKITDFVKYEVYETVSSSTVPGQQGSNTTSVGQVPIFSRSELETEVIVRSGQTVVMGGLIKSSEVKSESRVPLLSYIPIIGLLFRHDVVIEAKQNLLIFVTATIISEWGESLVPIGAAQGPGEQKESQPAEMPAPPASGTPAAVNVGG